MREPLRESKCGNEANATSSCTNIQADTQSDLFEGMGANSQVARQLAMSRFRLIQPHLEKTDLYNSSQPRASSRFEPLSAG
jgi:hypothetical protein